MCESLYTQFLPHLSELQRISNFIELMLLVKFMMVIKVNPKVDPYLLFVSLEMCIIKLARPVSYCHCSVNVLALTIGIGVQIKNCLLYNRGADFPIK